MNLKITASFLVFLLMAFACFSQTQTVRGTLTDQDSQFPLIGATIQIIGSDPLKGAVSDVNGHFRIENVENGRISLLITSIGYEDKVVPSVLVTAAKEVILNIPMIESIEKLDELVVTAQKDKSEVLNEMAMISARTFSVEETQRFAGSLSDPARMASGFAGVTGSAEGNNDIVVRGNSPKGIMWRLEGIEIPNPNHFANEGATGGPVNTLNSNMLDNSDFYSGAFSPEYGNALSGVFDIRFKKGNNEQREYTASASVLGLDFTSEGPFKKGYDGSYIVNYRYSSLALLSNLGVLDFGGIPKYQDMSFNVFLPVGKKQFISIFGLGGLSKISYQDEDEEGNIIWDGSSSADLGVTGISHTYFLSDRLFVKNALSASATLLRSQEDSFTSEGHIPNSGDAQIEKSTLRYASTLNFKVNAQHKLETGIVYSRLGYNFDVNSYNFETARYENVLLDNDHSHTVQAYSSWKYRASEKLTFINGLHVMHFRLNEFTSIEPRLGAKWNINEKNSFNAGFGLHSKLETTSTYLSKIELSDGSISQPNQNLKPSRAAHFVVGYDRTIKPGTHLKVEAYYQHLYQVPVGISPGSVYSLINVTEDIIRDSLANKGQGRNYGLEFTLERFFRNGFYYMSTASLYRSFYIPQDGLERRSAFDGKYVVNFLAGKEFQRSKNKVLFMNTKISLLGGNPYTPIDLEASKAIGSEVRLESNPYSAKGDDIFFINYSMGTRKNKGNTTREFKIDITNVTNNQGIVTEYYVPTTQSIYKAPQLPFIPNIVYSIKF